MSIVVAWDNPERTIVSMVVSGEWGWDDVTVANNQLAEMEAMVSQKVDVIIILHRRYLLPQNMLSNMRRYSYSRTEKTGLIVLVGANRLFQSIIHQYQKISPDSALHFAFANSVEDARAFLAKRRQHYPALSTIK